MIKMLVSKFLHLVQRASRAIDVRHRGSERHEEHRLHSQSGKHLGRFLITNLRGGPEIAVCDRRTDCEAMSAADEGQIE